eukprot:c14160_g1_i1.p1 GENE.c14160_g1_i1~~c14160_g1_i1.p1  ORF type:complete len:311 (+),score=90.37 c14160_g1_i1:554-1486(+)
MSGEVVAPTQPRFDETGQQLDPFNRPLPEGALPMFTPDQVPIGVGPDGNHYLPDGSLIPKSNPHFDADGNQLPQEIVDRAAAIAPRVNIAIKVRAHLKGEGESEEAVDALGRTFRQLNEDHNGMIINADGDKVPMHTARILDHEEKTLVDYKTFREKKSQTHRDQGIVPIEERQGVITVKQETEDGKAEDVCVLEVEKGSTLKDLRLAILSELPNTDFVFLVDLLPLMKYEEGNRLTLSLGEEIMIRPRRGVHAPPANPTKPFVKKIVALQSYEAQKEQEKAQFQDVLKKIQAGLYLKPVHKENINPADE